MDTIGLKRTFSQFENNSFPIINPPKSLADQSQQGVKQLQYQNILQQSFVYMFVGKPGCGQSHLISQMILRNDFYFQQFNKIVYISPSRVHPDINVSDEFYSSYLDQDYIVSVIDNLTKIASSRTDRRFNFLFVIDDCISALRFLSKSSTITNLFFNRRHIVPNANISIIVTTQQWQSVCSKIRSVVTGLFLFSPSPQQLQMLKAQYVFDKQMLRQAVLIVNQYFDKQKYQFLYIQLHPQTELYYNFLKVF